MGATTLRSFPPPTTTGYFTRVLLSYRSTPQRRRSVCSFFFRFSNFFSVPLRVCCRPVHGVILFILISYTSSSADDSPWPTLGRPVSPTHRRTPRGPDSISATAAIVPAARAQYYTCYIAPEGASAPARRYPQYSASAIYCIVIVTTLYLYIVYMISCLNIWVRILLKPYIITTTSTFIVIHAAARNSLKLRFNIYCLVAPRMYRTALFTRVLTSLTRVAVVQGCSLNHNNIGIYAARRPLHSDESYTRGVLTEERFGEFYKKNNCI